MDNNPNLDKFSHSLNAFYSSRLIIVDKTISDFLKMLAQDNGYMQIVADSARTSSFKQEFQKAIVNDENGLSFRLPMNRRHLITLVVGLLFEFDRKDISVIEFVRKFYPMEASHDSYMAFCDNIIKPFGEAFKALYLGHEEDEHASVTVADMEEKPFNDKAKEECDYWLNLIMGGMLEDSSFTKQEQKDALTMIKGMSYVTELANPLLIKLVWIGLKNTLGHRKSIYRELKEIETILINYGVID
ncbi:MAG: hypothetical protein IJ033_05005 [Clostridia bacterium]|nr:hypothetical protein [Clostridia bacterium]